jgi:predicted permease
MIRDLFQDLRYGLRSLRRSPGFTAMVVVSLALGIATNTAVFSVLDALMLRPLAVQDPARLISLTSGLLSGRGHGGGPGIRDGRIASYSFPLYARLRDANQAFEGLAAEDSMATSATVQRDGDGPAAEDSTGNGLPVTGNYFSVLGVSAYRGRTFLPEDQTTAGANPVTMLSHGFWQRRFGADPSLVGTRLSINGHPYTVVGITPPGFAGTKVGEAIDFWVPLTMHAQLVREAPLLTDTDGWWLVVMGRLKPGVSPATAEASVNVTLQQHLAEIEPQLRKEMQAPAARRAIRIGLEPGTIGSSSLRRDFREPLLALMAGVALLLLIVCLNVSHLLLARAIRRQREMSIRSALGASRGRLVRQLLTEGLLLSCAGTVVGMVATKWMTDALVSLAVSEAAGRALAVSADLRVLGFTAALGFGIALLLGLVPAWQASQANLQQALGETSGAIAGSGSRRLVSRLLLTSQVAFSLVLLAGAGLLAGSLRKLRDVDRGFAEERLLVVGVDLRSIDMSSGRGPVVFDDLLRRVTALSGVQRASLSSDEILAPGRWTTTISFAGAATSVQPSPHGFVVTPGYFDTVGMTVARGRGFTGQDRDGAPLVAVVNEALVRKTFGSADPLGKRFRFGDPSSSSVANIEVAGVVKDARIDRLRDSPVPAFYLPLSQLIDKPVNAVQVRTGGDPALLADKVRQALRDAHPGLRVTSVRTMTSAVDRSLRQERLLAALSTAFGLVALFLVCMGLYAIISQWAAQRTREIGVRMALGATRRGVRWMVLRQGFVLMVLGIAVGVPGAIAATRLLQGMLFGLSPTDPATLAAASLALFAVATLAAYLPARRASRVDPMMALRGE